MSPEKSCRACCREKLGAPWATRTVTSTQTWMLLNLLAASVAESPCLVDSLWVRHFYSSHQSLINSRESCRNLSLRLFFTVVLVVGSATICQMALDMVIKQRWPGNASNTSSIIHHQTSSRGRILVVTIPLIGVSLPVSISHSGPPAQLFLDSWFRLHCLYGGGQVTVIWCSTPTTRRLAVGLAAVLGPCWTQLLQKNHSDDASSNNAVEKTHLDLWLTHLLGYWSRSMNDPMVLLCWEKLILQVYVTDPWTWTPNANQWRGRVTLTYFWNQQLPIVSEWIDGITNRIAKWQVCCICECIDLFLYTNTSTVPNLSSLFLFPSYLGSSPGLGR